MSTMSSQEVPPTPGQMFAKTPEGAKNCDEGLDIIVTEIENLSSEMQLDIMKGLAQGLADSVLPSLRDLMLGSDGNPATEADEEENNDAALSPFVSRASSKAATLSRLSFLHRPACHQKVLLASGMASARGSSAASVPIPISGSLAVSAPTEFILREPHIRLLPSFSESDLVGARDLFFCLLIDKEIVTRRYNKGTQTTVTTRQAVDVTNFIFFEMLGGLKKRDELIQDDNGESLSLGEKAREAAKDIDNPEIVRHLYSNIHFLQQMTKIGNDEMGVVFRAWTYAQLYETWKDLKDGDKDASITSWIESQGPPPRGRKNIAWLKDMLCQEMGITRPEFTRMVQNSHLPFLFKEKFGEGSAIFFTKNFTKPRHIMYDAVLEDVVHILDEVMGHVLREVASITWDKSIRPRLNQ